MYLNEQFAAQGIEIVACLVVIAFGIGLSRWLERRHQRRLEELRLAALAVVHSLERLTAQTARDIQRKSQPVSEMQAMYRRYDEAFVRDERARYKDRLTLAQVDAHRHVGPPLADVLHSRLIGPLPPGFTFEPGPDPLAEFASERDIHGANRVDQEILRAYTVTNPQGYDAYGKPLQGGR